MTNKVKMFKSVNLAIQETIRPSLYLFKNVQVKYFVDLFLFLLFLFLCVFIFVLFLFFFSRLVIEWK